MQSLLDLGTGSPLSLGTLFLNLAVGVVLAAVLRWHFQRFGSTLSNRVEFSQVFAFILLTTILIITIVKSSLALSLGLVGALSIVRFRTPVKEPEELAYLFIAIAMGLGLGADQTVATVAGGLTILLVVAVFRWQRAGLEQKNLFLSVTCADAGQDARFLETLTTAVRRHVSVSDMRRVDVREGSWEATFLLDVKETSNLVSMMDDLRRSFPGIGLTVIDQNRMPSV
jgi:hypothetical protein